MFLHLLPAHLLLAHLLLPTRFSVSSLKELWDTGRLRRADGFANNPDCQAAERLIKVHGIGQSRALELVKQGVRTIDDLRARSDLSPQTRIWLKYIDELEMPIPRDHIGQVGDPAPDAHYHDEMQQHRHLITTISVTAGRHTPTITITTTLIIMWFTTSLSSYCRCVAVTVLCHSHELRVRIRLQVEARVAAVAVGLDKRLKAIACGSYRLGKAESRDMDVMLILQGARPGSEPPLRTEHHHLDCCCARHALRTAHNALCALPLRDAQCSTPAPC